VIRVNAQEGVHRLDSTTTRRRRVRTGGGRDRNKKRNRKEPTSLGEGRQQDGKAAHRLGYYERKGRQGGTPGKLSKETDRSPLKLDPSGMMGHGVFRKRGKTSKSHRRRR